MLRIIHKYRPSYCNNTVEIATAFACTDLLAYDIRRQSRFHGKLIYHKNHRKKSHGREAGWWGCLKPHP